MNTKISEAAALANSLRQIADAQYTRRQRFNGRLPADVQEVLRTAADHLHPQSAELAEQQGVAGWDIAEKVRADLDRQSCPDAYMRIAVESVVKHLAATGKQQAPVAWYVFADTEHWVTMDEDEAEENREEGCQVRPLVFADAAIATTDKKQVSEVPGVEFPPLPKSRFVTDRHSGTSFPSYTAEQMQDYALAATGKQQVGEVQGDDLLDQLSKHLPSKLMDRVNEALAARQPVGQVLVAWQGMETCPRDGTVVLLRWGEDHVSPGWWSAPVSPIQNEDGTWPSDSGGFPWAFFDVNDGAAFVNHAVDTEYGPTHWTPYASPPAHGIDGYQHAFYELAGMMGMTAQPRSPKEVWETQMRPVLQALTAPDPTLLRFYQVTDYPSLVSALESHVLKLIDTCARNVKPWEDTFPPTLLPKWQREQAAQDIDLGQLHRFIALATAVVHYGDESPMKNGVFAEAERLLAMIDSQRDPAPGVGNG